MTERAKADSKRVLDQYHNANGHIGCTLYVDPFALPVYFQPTYEASNGQVVFNPSATVAGFKCKEFSSINDLYGLMSTKEVERNLSLALATLEHRCAPENTPVGLFEYQLEACFKLRGKGGKTYYYKRRSVENGMIDGRITHALGYWEDISGWRSPQSFHWKLNAKNAEFFDFDLPEISQYQGMLSAREVQILRLLARGFSSRDIGEMLRITKNTVDTHRRNMLRKTEVANTPELLDMARDMNLLI